jgi:hypothetical protein
MTAAGPPSKAQLIILGTRVLAGKFAELAAACDVTEAARAAGSA